MKSDFSVGLADKFCAAWDSEGGTPVELNSFAERAALVRGVLAIVRGEAVVKPIQPLTEEAPKPAPFQFKVGRTIKLGLYKTPAEYRKALKAANVEVGTYAGQILDKVTVSKTVVEIDISEPFSIADIGFRTGTTRYDAIKKRIIALGGELCPNETGPAARLQSLDQLRGDWYRIAMGPLADAVRDLFVFSVVRDDYGLFLFSVYGDPDTLCRSGNRFVCVVPRK
mgnify:CR=1 FL=1